MRGDRMKLIIGLGNPGKEYENTRHNIGFMAIDNYVKFHNLGDFKEKFNGMYLKYQLGDEQIILVKPLSFMNLSGDVVRRYVDYFKVDVKDILITKTNKFSNIIILELPLAFSKPIKTLFKETKINSIICNIK